MPNYKESSVAGSSYVRAGSVFIDNGLINKSIAFQEQEVMTLGDEVISKSLGLVASEFTAENQDTAFALLDPETNQQVDGQTMTFADVYNALYSLYLHLALERDAAAEAEPEPDVDEEPEVEDVPEPEADPAE